jgi:GT2 family glycosyltransferase
VGGKVNLVSMAENPGWLHRKLLPYLGAFDYGTTHRLLSYPEYPYGLNMSFRKAVFGRIGFFRVDLGRTGDLLLSNEERDLCYRIEKSGGLIGYAPDAVVYHHIPTARLSKGWFLSRFYWQGRSDYVFDRLHFSHQHIRGQILKKAFRIAVGLAKLVFSREEDERFYRRCQIYACYGYLRQTGRKV